jgi:hypothetical protein
MRPVLLNQGNSSDSTTTDSIDVELHQSYFPYVMVLSRRSLFALDGSIILNLPYILGNYYIAIKHRNAIQTWSASPISFAASQINYDFTTDANKAYGNNMKELEPGVWAFYSGDINQDENIDLIDLSLLEGDINSFAYGYLATDINGDGNVDLLDLTSLETNINNFIFSNHP